MKKSWLSVFVFSGVLLLALGACSTVPSQKENQNIAKPGDLVSTLDQDLIAAKADGVDVLAPELFLKAQSEYLKARKALDKGDAVTAVQGYAAQSRESLNQAITKARTARKILADTNEAREKAIVAGAPKLGQPFDEVEAQYNRLTTAIKNNNLAYAQENSQWVQNRFHKVEIMAIKHNALEPTRRLMAEADQQRVAKIAPQSYDEANRALQSADDFIGLNPYAKADIQAKADHAYFLAQRMMSVVKSSRRFEALEPEPAALYVEELMVKLSGALNVGDIRNLDTADQVDTLSAAAQNLIAANRNLSELNQSYQTQIAAMEERINGLQGFSQQQEAAKERLAAERQFNEKFDQVQNYFTPSEAEVYKQGNQLVIRMRGIKFPVGQSTLSPQNYGLLSKVQRAIHTFEKSTILIEGHTDSTGSDQINKKLSQDRAEAVKAYLIANDADMAGRVKAVGFGSDHPLATNDTPEGRAINRRIDVRISPAPVH